MRRFYTIFRKKNPNKNKIRLEIDWKEIDWKLVYLSEKQPQETSSVNCAMNHVYNKSALKLSQWLHYAHSLAGFKLIHQEL